MGLLVPNAPCGVESDHAFYDFHDGKRFLMHRVELKVEPLPVNTTPITLFLMHRVELKAMITKLEITPFLSSS